MGNVFNLALSLWGAWWVFPVMVILVCTGVGVWLEQLGIISSWYTSPYVLAVAWATLRSGRSGGLLATALSALLWNYLFVPPIGLHWPTNDELISCASMVGVALVMSSHVPPSKDTRSLRYIGLLPFARHSSAQSSGYVFWDVEANGIWHEDCAVGSEYGRIYLDRLRRQEAPLLAWIVRDMIRGGKFTGVEAGFMSVVAQGLVQYGSAGIKRE